MFYCGIVNYSTARSARRITRKWYISIRGSGRASLEAVHRAAAPPLSRATSWSLVANFAARSELSDGNADRCQALRLVGVLAIDPLRLTLLCHSLQAYRTEIPLPDLRDFGCVCASFFATGSGVAKQRNLGLIDMRRIAPTIANILESRYLQLSSCRLRSHRNPNPERAC